MNTFPEEDVDPADPHRLLDEQAWQALWTVPELPRGVAASHPNGNWFFPGVAPGWHISPAQLRERLHPLFSPRAARLATLHELTKLAPIAIIAEALGYTARTIEHHAKGAAITYAEYVASHR